MQPPDRLGEVEAENARLRALLIDQERRFSAEMQHQIRNTLAVVRSILHRSATDDPAVEEYLMHVDGRVGAVLRVQASRLGPGMPQLDLHSLVSDELLFLQAKEGERAFLTGPEVLLERGVAASLVLAFHELATNALKYGALAQEGGRIQVSWHRLGGDAPGLRILWQEEAGPRVAAPERTGFGLELFERVLPYELDARCTVSFEPTGLCWQLDLPLSAGLGLREEDGRPDALT